MYFVPFPQPSCESFESMDNSLGLCVCCHVLTCAFAVLYHCCMPLSLGRWQHYHCQVVTKCQAYCLTSVLPPYHEVTLFSASIDRWENRSLQSDWPWGQPDDWQSQEWVQGAWRQNPCFSQWHPAHLLCHQRDGLDYICLTCVKGWSERNRMK